MPRPKLRGSPIRNAFGASLVILTFAAAPSARADDPAKILKSMTDYLSGQTSLSASFDSDIEVITPELQKIQFSSSGQMKLSRPDKLRVRRTGGYADVEMVYDGRTMSLYGNNAKSFVQADLAGTVDEMIDRIQARSGVGMPGTDLLLSNAYDELMAATTEGKHVGMEKVGGKEAHHLTFKQPNLDWEIWVAAEGEPFVLKAKSVLETQNGKLSTIETYSNWKLNPDLNNDVFKFKAPEEAKKVDRLGGQRDG